MASATADPVSEGFVKATLMIFLNEIGDKTFFISAIYSMRESPLHVMAGSLGALWLMTVLSAGLGAVATKLISPSLTHHAATALFFYFGLRLLYSTLAAWESGDSELAEVESELAADAKGKGKKGKSKAKVWGVVPTVVAEIFSLVFIAEWGDRSQIATIGLAAQDNVLGVVVGACLGHLLCTGGAVAGGRTMAAVISERAVQVCGGVLFLLFGLHSLLADNV